MHFPEDANLRHFGAGLSSVFLRNAHQFMWVRIELRPIIHIYVNFSGLFRSRLEPISAGFEVAASNVELATSDGRPGTWSPGIRVFCARWHALAWMRARSEVGTRMQEGKFGKPENGNPGTGTPPPLPYVFAVGFLSFCR